MASYTSLKKIIPPDQALANKALSISLRQVKGIFNSTLPEVSATVLTLESNKGLGLINDLSEPVPQSVLDYFADTLGTGTGPGNTVTIMDMIGTAAGNTFSIDMPVVVSAIGNLADANAFYNLTANGGTANSSINGVYTVMQYALANAYTNDMGGSIDITIPAPLPGQGTYGPEPSFQNVISNAFVNLISNAATAINNIVATNAYSAKIDLANSAWGNMTNQLRVNVVNCTAAELDINNITNDIANAELIANSTSSLLALGGRLHEIGLDISVGGSAQFFDAVANTQTLSGQAVVSSLREGRNIATLNAAGMSLDTQLPDINPNQQINNNLSSAQYSSNQATANLVF